jgi:hypothetical protein
VLKPIIPGVLDAGDFVSVKGSRDYTAALLKRVPQLVPIRIGPTFSYFTIRDRVGEARREGISLLLYFERSGRTYTSLVGCAALVLEAKSATTAEVIRLDSREVWGKRLKIVANGVSLVDASL